MSIDTAVFSRRVERVQEMMRRQGLDLLILGPTANMYYLTGLKTAADERLQALAVPAEGPPVLLLPAMYEKEARAKVKEGFQEGFELHAWSDGEDPLGLLAGALAKKQGRAAVDDRMWAAHLLAVMRALPGLKFTSAAPVMMHARRVKEPEELARLKEAGTLADRVMAEVREAIRPGVAERELAFFIERRIRELGAEDVSFRPIVASGPNGANPHHVPGERRLAAGDFVVVDFGAVLKGYCSDITRTFSLGGAGAAMKEAYRAVQDANEAGFAAARAGIPCEEVDRAARAVIEAAGYGEFFIHRTGHGIGLDVHEEPYLVAGSAEPLEPGMVFSVEPGIYLPGRFGVRIEDIVAVTEDGPVRLNSFPRELIEIIPAR